MDAQHETPVNPLEYATGTKRSNKESRVGVWSLRLALVALALLSAAMIIPIALGRPRSVVATSPFGSSAYTIYPQNWGIWEDTIKICVVAGALLTVAALILGIIGAAQRTHARRWATIGLIISGILLVPLMAVG